MAENAEKEVKVSPLQQFREKLKNREQLKAALQEGLGSTNAKVRALAARLAYKTQEQDFIKKHVMPLLTSEKTKRVYRSFAKRINRKSIEEKLKQFAKVAPAKKEKKVETPPAEVKS